MPTHHLSAKYAAVSGARSGRLGPSRTCVAGLAHLRCMTLRLTEPSPVPTEGTAAGTPAARPAIDAVVTLTELCDHLHVPAQTIYDLRCQGRGPRGFRVGRELRFRASEIEAWLTRMEQDDARRHGPGAG